MKRRIILDAPIEELFNALISPTIENYKNVKHKNPTEEQLKYGLTYQVEVPNSKPKRYATVKVLKYDKPHQFSMEYKSSAYHKIDSLWLNKMDNGKTEVITEHKEESIKNGKVVSSRGQDDSDVIKPVSLFERGKYMRLAYAIKKGVFNNSND